MDLIQYLLPFPVLEMSEVRINNQFVNPILPYEPEKYVYWMFAIKVENKEESIIDEFCNPYDIINDAKEEATFICSMTHINNIPPIHIHGVNDFTFSYIPSHLFYVTLEILKNSLNSTINFHKTDHDKPINVYLSKGKDDLIIKISDLGGGFPVDDLK